MTTASNQSITALAVIVHELRPDWDTRGIAWALHKAAANVTLDALAVAFIRAAADPANLTPAAVLHADNRAWNGAGIPPCPVHPLQRSRRTDGECGGCYADRMFDPDSRASFTRRPPPAAVDRARAELRRETPVVAT